MVFIIWLNCVQLCCVVCRYRPRFPNAIELLAAAAVGCWRTISNALYFLLGWVRVAALLWSSYSHTLRRWLYSNSAAHIPTVFDFISFILLFIQFTRHKTFSPFREQLGEEEESYFPVTWLAYCLPWSIESHVISPAENFFNSTLIPFFIFFKFYHNRKLELQIRTRRNRSMGYFKFSRPSQFWSLPHNCIPVSYFLFFFQPVRQSCWTCMHVNTQVNTAAIFLF